MTSFFNRVVFRAAAGGVDDFAVSAAVTGFRTPLQAGVPNGAIVSYTAENATKTQWETGIGTYVELGTTLQRTTIRESTNGDAAVNFSTAPAVFFEFHAQDIPALGEQGEQGPQGATGLTGNSIFVETAEPSTSGVSDGSIWIDADSTDVDLYELVGGVWVDTSTNLKGPPGGTPGGATTQVQFNDAGSFAGEAALAYNKTADALEISGAGCLSVDTNNPLIDSTATHRRAAEVIYRHNFPLTNEPNFSNVEGITVTLNADNGDNVHGGGTNAKTTFLAGSFTTTAISAGQRFSVQNLTTAYGMGDAALYAGRVAFAGGNINGDEGMGYNLVQSLYQQRNLSLATITALPTPATIDTTTTQVINASKDPQTVTVASSTGVVADQWVVVEQSMDDGANNLEAVKVISVPSGTSIEGIFRCGHLSGVTVKAAKVIEVDDAFEFGEQRLLINLSGATHTTGSVATAGPGGSMTGSGSNWTTGMVGGSADCIGAISLDDDTYTGIPFNSTGEAGPLRAWYQITSVASTTLIGIHKFSVAGDTGYAGNGADGSAYIIRPAMRILRRVGNTLICEVNTSTWSIGHDVECSICPWPDVSAFQYHFGVWTPGGTYRRFMHIKNTGARTFTNAIEIDSALASGGGADTIAYEQGILVTAPVDIGVAVGNANTYGIRLQGGGGDGSRIGWNVFGGYIKENQTFDGIEIAGCENNTISSGRLNFIDQNVSASGLSEMSFGGLVHTSQGYQAPIAFSSALPDPTIRDNAIRFESDNGDFQTYIIYSDGALWRPTGPRYGRVTGDFSVTNSTALVEVSGLKRTLQAGRTYTFIAELPFTCATTGGVQAAMSGTATVTDIRYDGWIIDSAANGIKGNAQSAALDGVVASALTAGTAGHITIKGTITVNAAGTLFVAFAQNTSDGTASIVKRGATLEVADLF